MLNKGAGDVAKLKKKDFDITKIDSMSSAEIAQYLDDRELRFAKEYLIDRCGTQAAIRAGYKPGKNNASAAVQGSRLIKDERIIAYRRSLMKDELEALDVNRENVIMSLLDIKQTCLEAGDSRGAIKSLAEVAKIVGLYAPEKKEIDTNENLENLLAELINDKIRSD